MVAIIANQWGYNPSTDGSTSEEDVIYQGGNQYWASVESFVSISSTSADDALGGTGCNAVHIDGVDGSYRHVHENVNLNGLTPVQTKFKYLRVNRTEMIKAGTLLANAGDITASDGSGVMSFIGAGRGQSMEATFTLPNNFDNALLALLTGQIAEKQSHTAIAELKFRENGSGWVTRYVYSFTTAGNFALSAGGLGLQIKPETDISLRIVDADADGLAILAGYTIISNPDTPFLLDLG